MIKKFLIIILILFMQIEVYGQLSEKRKSELKKQYAEPTGIKGSALRGGFEYWFFDDNTPKGRTMVPSLFLRPTWKGSINVFFELKSQNSEFDKVNESELQNWFGGISDSGNFKINFFAVQFLNPVPFINEIRIGNLWLDYSPQTIYAKWSLSGFLIKSSLLDTVKNEIFYLPMYNRGYITGFKSSLGKFDNSNLTDYISLFFNGLYDISGYYYKKNSSNTNNDLQYTELALNFRVKDKKIINHLYFEGGYAFLQYNNYITNSANVDRNTGVFYDPALQIYFDKFKIKYRYTYISKNYYIFSTSDYMSKPILASSYRPFFEPIKYKPDDNVSDEKLIDNFFETEYFINAGLLKLFYDFTYQPEYSLNISGVETGIFFNNVMKYFLLIEYKKENKKYKTIDLQLKKTKTFQNKFEVNIISDLVMKIILRYDYITSGEMDYTFITKYLELSYKPRKKLELDFEIKNKSPFIESSAQSSWWWDSWTRFWFIDNYIFCYLKINF